MARIASSTANTSRKSKKQIFQFTMRSLPTGVPFPCVFSYPSLLFWVPCAWIPWLKFSYRIRFEKTNSGELLDQACFWFVVWSQPGEQYFSASRQVFSSVSWAQNWHYGVAPVTFCQSQKFSGNCCLFKQFFCRDCPLVSLSVEALMLWLAQTLVSNSIDSWCLSSASLRYWCFFRLCRF